MDFVDDLTSEQNYSAGALIGTFIGDALGMPVEGWDYRRIQSRQGKIDGMLEARLGKGTYTDDTQMMVATAKSLIESNGVNPENMAEQFLDHYDPRRGYGQGTTMVFRKWRDGVSVSEASEQIFEGGSFGNGGSMRIAPVAVYFHHDKKQLLDAVRTACGLTHAHPLGQGSSFLQARSISMGFDIEPQESLNPDDWISTLEDELPEDLDPENILYNKLQEIKKLLQDHEDTAPYPEVIERLGCTSKAYESVPASIYAFLANLNSFHDALTYGIGIGGDTDTIGAMVGAIAGAYHGLEGVPEEWWNDLENEKDGRDDIVKLSKKLLQ